MSNRVKLRKTMQRLNAAGQSQDAAYFNRHEDRDDYTRPATPAELRAAGLPPGTLVHVHLLGDRRIRMFEPPNVRQS
jgi:hypothetical protein